MYIFAKGILKILEGFDAITSPSQEDSCLAQGSTLCFVPLRLAAFWSRKAMDQRLSVWETQALPTSLQGFLKLLSSPAPPISGPWSLTQACQVIPTSQTPHLVRS